MDAFSEQDKLHLNAARQAVREADFARAEMELGLVRLRLQTDVQVLKVRWLLHAAGGDWETCLAIARNLTIKRPGDAACWVALVKSLVRTDRFEEAQTLVKEFGARFPNYPSLHEVISSAVERLHSSAAI